MITTQPGTYTPLMQRIRPGMLLPAILLGGVIVYCVTASIAASPWAPGIDILPIIGLPAFLLGSLLAQPRRLPTWLAHILSLLAAIGWGIAQIGPTLISEISREQGTASASRLTGWGDYGAEVLIRLISWSRVLQAGGRGEDIVLYLMALILLAWMIGYLTAWLIFRGGRAWPAVILNAFPLLINYTFAWPKPTILFFIFLGAALLLVSHQQIIRQQQLWDAAQIDYPELLGVRFIAAAALFLGALVVVTGLLPANISSAQVSRAWELMRSPFVAVQESWQNAFSTIQAPPGTSGGGFTTRNVRVGGGRSLSDEIVMRVQSPRYDYWRAVTFDRYTGNGWQSTVGERARTALGSLTAEDARSALEVGQSIPQTDLRGRRLYTQTVEIVQQRADRLLMVGGQFNSAGLPVYLQHGMIADQDGRMLPNIAETASIMAQAPALSAGTYTVTVYMSVVDEQSLRQASTTYPAWVRENYLQLPDGVTQRTRELAREIITRSNATNPYDQVVAIERELRRLTYDEKRPSPVERGDWVDYFLFESQRGYCDDFASAFVVLARSLGIPARWVQGYAGGTYDSTTASYIVRESIAHSWPEVYFPGYGWQRFEPTPAGYATPASRPLDASGNGDESDSGPGVAPAIDPLERLRELNQADQQLTDEQIAELNRIANQRRQAELLRQVALGGGVLLGVGMVIALGLFLWRRDLRGLGPAASVYARLGRAGSLVGSPPRDELTPNEYGSELARYVPGQRRALDRIVRAYSDEHYGGKQTTEHTRLEEDLSVIRRELIRERLLRWRQREP